MGRPNGYEKASRATDRIIAKLDRQRDETVSVKDSEGLGITGAYRGPLFGVYHTATEGRRVYVPQKKG